MGPPCVEGQSPRECSLPPMLGPGGGPACPPPVTGSNTRVFTRQAVISLHTDPVRAAESPTHPTCPGLPSDFCLSCCSFQSSIIKSGIKMSPILRPNYGLFLCSCHELRGACWRAGGGAGCSRSKLVLLFFQLRPLGAPLCCTPDCLFGSHFGNKCPGSQVMKMKPLPPQKPRLDEVRVPPGQPLPSPRGFPGAPGQNPNHCNPL